MCDFPQYKFFYYGQLQTTTVASLNAVGKRGAQLVPTSCSIGLWIYSQNAVESAIHSRVTQMSSSKHTHIFLLLQPNTTLEYKILILLIKHLILKTESSDFACVSMRKFEQTSELHYPLCIHFLFICQKEQLFYFRRTEN